MKKTSEITGERFGKLIAIEPAGKDKNGHVLWRCKCDCGAEKLATKSSLIAGLIKSCGNHKIKRLEGEKFGRLTAIEEVGRNKNNDVLWRCKCECGNEVIASASTLIVGYVKSCGKHRVKRLEGEKFGRLTAIEEVGRNKYYSAMWRCECDCGEEITVASSRLLNGSKRSCGCERRKVAAQS